MGYSGRYHAASLAAVFLALAVGILVGVGFGSDIVTGTAESVEESLGSDLTEARDRIEELEAELDRERNLLGRLHPAVVGGRLAGAQVAIVAVGAVPEDVVQAVDDAIDPAGGSLTEIAVIPGSPDLDALAEALLGDDADRLPPAQAVQRAGRRAGSALARGTPRFDVVRGSLLTRYSGAPAPTSDVVLFHQLPPDLDEESREDVERLEAGLVTGLRAAGVTVVGVERSDEEESSIEHFNALEISTVDNIDALPGKVALAFALAGTSGNFGTKDTADRLLPDLLPPAAAPIP